MAADLIAVAIGELLEAGVEMGAAAAGVLDAGEFVGVGGADVEKVAVVSEDFEGLDVVVGFAGHDGVDAAGVVADHAAEGAALVGSGIGGEGEVMLLGLGAEGVEDDAGLYAGDAALGIDLEDAVHVFGEVENDGGVAALTGEGGAAAAGEERGAMVAAEGDGGEDVFFVARDDDTNGDLAVVGAVGRIESAGAVVEADFAAKVTAEGGFERLRVQLSGTQMSGICG